MTLLFRRSVLGAKHHILLNLNGREPQACCYRLAGVPVLVDLRAEILEPFAVYADANPRKVVPNNDLPDVIRGIAGDGRKDTEWTAWICKAHRRIYATRLRDDLLITIEGLGEFVICPDQAFATRVDADSKLSTNDALEIALGPLLTPLLAHRGVFCLHASAVCKGGETTCFIGESGTGKSTLAAYLGEKLEYVRRAADDVVPVQLEEGLVALLGYPQLKIPASEQTGWNSEVKPVTTVIEVQATRAGEGEMALNLCTRAQSCLMLARHAVAARLFGSELLAEHLEFCAAASEHVRTYTLRYPHERNSLPRALELLREEFGWR